MWRLVVGTVILAQYLTNYITNGEVFSSTARLTKLYTSTNDVIGVLDIHIRKGEERIIYLKRIQEDLIALAKIQVIEDVNVPEHPVGAFNIIQTYYNLNNYIDLNVKDNYDFEQYLLNKSTTLPTHEDYKGALSAMLRLQHIYQLETSDLVTGNVKNRCIGKLSRTDAYMIGQHSLSIDRYKKYRVNWLEAALAGDSSEPVHNEFPPKTAYLDLTKEYLESSRLDDAMKCINRFRELYPDDEESISAYIKTKLRVDFLKRNEVDTKFTDKKKEKAWYINYCALCRGDDSVIRSDVNSSYCTWSPSSLPYIRVKMEVLSLEPYIVMYHDVITDSEAKYLRQSAFAKLERANVTAEGVVSQVRVAQIAWLNDTIQEFKKVSQRVMTLTGLDSTFRHRYSSAEPFQAVNYGIGGQYEPHVDDNGDPNKTVQPFVKDSGDRMATFLLYLDDVVEGGATVFPQVGIRVPVVKNSAVFWYNLYRSGMRDYRTLHAGCPVLLGQKWAANKWIWEHGQEFRHPCGLTPRTPHYPLILS